MFVLFSFVFVVRPLIQWLTTNTASELGLLSQLPKTIDEVEREYGGGLTDLPYKTKALQMIENDKERSAEVVREWLKSS